MAPTSILSHRSRQRARLDGAIDRVWFRDHGEHQAELRRLIQLVDADALPISEALLLVADLDRRTTRAARVA